MFVCVCPQTWAVPAQPLVKDGVSEGVQQDEDGVVRGQVRLSPGPVQEQVGQVVEAADHRVISPLRGRVA